MPIFEITADAIIPIMQTTFPDESITERGDLQRVLRSNISAIAPDCYVLKEEFGDWDGTKRRIDLLCIDKNANLVVIELKRSEDGGHSDLQAIRYAAMIHLMTFEDAVNAHAEFLKKSAAEARQSILDFLEWDEVNEEEFAKDVSIILVSAEFNKEVTSTAIWLNKKGIELRCVRMKPYRFENKILVDIQQILPQPETATYQVQLKKKEEEQRQSMVRNNDYSKYDLSIKDVSYPELTKRKLCFLVVQALFRDNVLIEQIMNYLRKGMWLCVDGICDHDEFASKFSEQKTSAGNLIKLNMYYTLDDELFHENDKTYAFTNQVGINTLSNIDELIKQYPACSITYTKSPEVKT